jgi:aspartyl-tRNA(Asn)/glutamyl-tRNA(Gln) amidotransferase subunit C
MHRSGTITLSQEVIMADEITPELFDHLVELAALELTPEEAEYLRHELNSQLKAIHELERIPIPDDVPAAAHGVTFRPGIRSTLRDDTPRSSEQADKILKQAPEADEGYFVVPEIPHTELK